MAGELVRTSDLGAALVKVKGRGERTTEAYRGAVKAFTCSGYPITPAGFAEYVEGLRRNRAAAGVNLVIAAGKAAFAQAAFRMGMPEREAAILRGALADIHGTKLAPPEVRVLSPEEREILFHALPARIRIIAEVLYMTGARISEILMVRSDAVKVDGEHVSLRLYGKGRKERMVGIPLRLYRRIRGTFQPGPYLFTTDRGHHYTRQYVTREIDRAARRALGKGSSAHVLRHSRATDLVRDTGRIKAVSRLLGHSDEATTLRYYVKDSFSDEELFEEE
ncbi:MAG: tyrosine-type recombinase/integrase [Spirochaetia bacterium]|jgi:integrase/recombinase XerD